MDGVMDGREKGWLIKLIQSLSFNTSTNCNSFAPDQLTVADVEGRINNFIDVTHFKPFNEDSSTLDIARKEDEVRGWTWM